MNIVLCIVMAIGQASPAGEQQSGGVDKVQLERWQKYYREVAGQYEVHAGAEHETILELQDRPVITYFNPVGGGETYGSIFVWTRDGRPEVAGAIWSKRRGEERNVVHSFHSLSKGPVRANRLDKVFWSPSRPGIEPVIVSDAADPAGTPQARLAQMRAISRDVHVSTVRETVERELRMLPQPVFRFDKSAVDRDGGLFVWFEDWDPELLMLIETRATPEGAKWHMSFARFTNLPVAAEYKDRKVWSFTASDVEPAQGGPDHRYISVHRMEILPNIRNE